MTKATNRQKNTKAEVVIAKSSTTEGARESSLYCTWDRLFSTI